MSNPIFPNATVPLSDEDGNSMFIISRVRRALRSSGASNAEIETFTNEATSGDYDNVLRTAMKWVNCT